MSKKSTSNGASNNGKTEIPAAPSGFKLIPLYKPVWRGKPGTKVAGHLLGIQPEQALDGSRFTAIMCKVKGIADVTRTDHTGTSNFDAKDGEIIAIDGSEPCMEKLIVLAQSQEWAHEIELWAIQTNQGVKKLLFVSEKPASRSEVDPVVIAANKHAAEAAGNGAG